MKVTVIPIVMGALGTFPKGTRSLENKISEDHPDYSIKLDQNSEESWKLEETCYHPNSSGIPSPYDAVKNSQIVIIMLQTSVKRVQD